MSPSPFPADDLQSSLLDAHRSFCKAPRRLPEVRLVLLGERETGKSNAGNAILGKSGEFTVGVVTEECSCQQAEVADRLVTVVDTPGWEGGAAGETPDRVKREVVSSVTLCPPGPHALLLTLRVDTLVTAGHVREHLELFGEGAWRHTILLFTHCDQLREDVDIAQHIQSGGRDLQWILHKCSDRYHVVTSAGMDQGSSMVTELLQKVEQMAVTNRCEAFSDLVQEVRDLTRQRNEKFNHRIKAAEDKMLQQELELRTMRERDMKSIKFFIRRKKQKSPQKIDTQREDEEDQDKVAKYRKDDDGELEERIRWLTEDKERQIQELLIEKERIKVDLKQSRMEKDEALLSLEFREREVEELKTKIDEQQMKLLDLQQTCSHTREKEKKLTRDLIRAKEYALLSEVEKVEGKAETQRAGEAEWMQKINLLKNEMEEIKGRYELALERKANEKNKEMAEMKERFQLEMLEKDNKCKEVEKEMSEEKQLLLERMKQHEETTEISAEAMRLQQKNEMETKDAEILILKKHCEEVARKCSDLKEAMEEMKCQHREELERQMSENTDDKEQFKQQCESEKQVMMQESQKEIALLRSEFAKDTERQLQAEKREMLELEEKYDFQMEEAKLQNEEATRVMREDMMQKMLQKEEELEALKVQHKGEIVANKEEVEKLKQQMAVKHKEETDQRVKDAEELMEKIQQQCRDRMTEIGKERTKEMEELRREYVGREETQLQQRQEMEKAMEKMKEQVEELEQQLRKAEQEGEGHRKQMEQELAEKDRVIENLTQHRKDDGETREQERVELQGLREKLEEKKIEVEHLQLQAVQLETRQKEEEEARESKMESLKGLLESKTRDIVEKENELEELRREFGSCLERIEELQGSVAAAELVEKLQEKDLELQELRLRDAESEKELQQLRLSNEQNRCKREKLTRRMEEEATSMIQQYEKELADRNRDLEECQQRAVDLTDKYEESRRCVAELHEQNGSIMEDSRRLRAECEQLRKESQDLKELAEEHQRQMRSREEELSSVVEVKDQEVRTLEREIQEIRQNLVFRDKAIQEEVAQREEEVCERERLLRSSEVELSQRGRQLDAREEALVEREARMGRLEEEEREVESLRQVLEEQQGKISNLNCHLLRKTTELEEQTTHWLKKEAELKEEVSRQHVELKKCEEELLVREKRLKKRVGGGGRRRRSGEPFRLEDALETGSESDGDENTQEASGLSLKKGTLAMGGNNHHPQTPRVQGDDMERSEVIAHSLPRIPSDNSSGVRVMVLGESWAGSCPAGLSLLCGQTPRQEAATFSRWCGEVEGQPLTAVEPLGIRWRDGPQQTNSDKVGRALEGAAWPASGAALHAVLLLVPAFLTCTQKFRRAVEENLAPLGPDVWQRTLLVFTWGETLGEGVEQHILRNSELAWLAERCGAGYHVVVSDRSDGLLGKVQEMQASQHDT